MLGERYVQKEVETSAYAWKEYERNNVTYMTTVDDEEDDKVYVGKITIFKGTPAEEIIPMTDVFSESEIFLYAEHCNGGLDLMQMADEYAEFEGWSIKDWNLLYGDMNDYYQDMISLYY